MASQRLSAAWPRWWVKPAVSAAGSCQASRLRASRCGGLQPAAAEWHAGRRGTKLGGKAHRRKSSFDGAREPRRVRRDEHRTGGAGPSVTTLLLSMHALLPKARYRPVIEIVRPRLPAAPGSQRGHSAEVTPAVNFTGCGPSCVCGAPPVGAAPRRRRRSRSALAIPPPRAACRKILHVIAANLKAIGQN